MPETKNGSALAGFKRLHVGVFDSTGEKIKTKYVWEDEKGGTVNLNITGLTPETVDMWASNKRVWMKKQGTGEVKSDMDLFNIPTEHLDKILGRDKDENGTSWVGEDTRAPYVAIIGESSNAITGDPIYCALVKGTLGLESIETKTKEKNEEAPEPTKLAGDWMNRTIGEKSRIYGYHEGKEGADEFMKLVFPGYEEGSNSEGEEGSP